ncbi:MAG: TetR family transcriptional regulator [Nocardioides sp.]
MTGITARVETAAGVLLGLVGVVAVGVFRRMMKCYSTQDEICQGGRVSTPARRGRRPGSSKTRVQIQDAARRLFAEHGFVGTSLRQVAAEAGVDVRLVSHYFGSKADLFVAAVELPFDPEPTFDALLGPGPDGLGERVAAFMLGVLDGPAGQTMVGLVRAAASEEQAAAMLRDRLVGQLLLPLARRLGSENAELRASLMGSQVAGLVMARHVVGLPPLVAADSATLVPLLAPVLEHYLTAPMPH